MAPRALGAITFYNFFGESSLISHPSYLISLAQAPLSDLHLFNKNPCHYKFVNSTNVNAGNVSAATIPIMPNVINTSAKVKPLDQPLDVTPSPTGVRLAFRSPTPATLSHEERAIISSDFMAQTESSFASLKVKKGVPFTARFLKEQERIKRKLENL